MPRPTSKKHVEPCKARLMVSFEIDHEGGSDYPLAGHEGAAAHESMARELVELACESPTMLIDIIPAGTRYEVTATVRRPRGEMGGAWSQKGDVAE